MLNYFEFELRRKNISTKIPEMSAWEINLAQKL